MANKKKYRLPNYTFGVEIECFNVSNDILAYEMSKRGLDVGSRGRDISCCAGSLIGNPNGRVDSKIHWDLGHDGSIRGGRHDQGLELRSPILRGEAGLKQIEAACAALNDIGAKVNASCGLHVHVGIKNSTKKFSVQQILKVMSQYEDNSSKIDRFVKANRRTGKSTYAQPVKNFIKEVSAPTKKTSVYEYGPDPYYGGYGGRYVTKIVPNNPPRTLMALANLANHCQRVNFSAYREHGTIEFRQHHGTVDAKEITNWIRFLLNHIEVSRGLYAKEKAMETPSKKKKKIDILSGLPARTRTHFQARLKKYRASKA